MGNTGKSSIKNPRIEERVAWAVSNGRLRLTDHANRRMRQREILYADIVDVLREGRREVDRDYFNEEYGEWRYGFLGLVESRWIRVMLAQAEPMIVVVTAMEVRDEEKD